MRQNRDFTSSLLGIIITAGRIIYDNHFSPFCESYGFVQARQNLRTRLVLFFSFGFFALACLARLQNCLHLYSLMFSFLRFRNPTLYLSCVLILMHLSTQASSESVFPRASPSFLHLQKLPQSFANAVASNKAKETRNTRKRRRFGETTEAFMTGPKFLFKLLVICVLFQVSYSHLCIEIRSFQNR